LSSFFKNKRVLITGHTGFVGSWVTLWLNMLEADVVGFSLNPPSNPSHYELLGIEKNITNIKGDIRNGKEISDAIKEHKPEIILHLAAQPILLRSYENPLDTYTTNVVGTLNLLEASRKEAAVKVIINVTTDKVYENLNRKEPYVEEDKLGGNDPYSSSKACSELITKAYEESFLTGAGVATARAGNIIGGGDWGERRIITDIVNAKKERTKLIIKNPESIRPWSNVLDVINGYLILCENLYHDPKGYSGAWNFSANETKTVLDLVKEFSMHWNMKYEIKRPEKRLEEELLLLDSTKSRTKLNWKPKMSFEESVKQTALWFDSFFKNGGGMKAYSADRVVDFIKK
jgi:CDP-glucose 4,6-dehydratase